MAKDWEEYNKFEEVNDKYLPAMGEGETMATQVVTAVNKLVYKWYNDGDVYDNVHSGMTGWCNDLSSYANWLHRYVGGETGADTILEGIKDCSTEGDYEDLLMELADTLLDEEWLELENKMEKVGSVYECEGPFEFTEECEEDEDEWWEDEEEW